MMQCTIDFAATSATRIRRVFSRPRQCLVAHSLAEVAPLLRKVSDHCQAGCYAAGFVSYEAAPAFDASLATYPPIPALPLAMFGLFDAPEVSMMNTSLPLPVPLTEDWCPDWDYAEYQQALAQLHQAIADGETYQVNLTLRYVSRLIGGTATALYEHLFHVQSADYCAHIAWDQGDLLSLSPELFFRTEGQRIETMPMKGTSDLGVALADCPKNRAENLMIVDLLRNDLSRLARPGSIKVTDLFKIHELSTVQQMTSTVCAELHANTTLDQIFGALFPCGSITGAPKHQTMRWITTLETSARGPYCGAMGWVAPGGDAQFNVAIRTLWHEATTHTLTCGVGGGITWDSKAREEWSEIQTKARFLDSPPAPFDLLETLRLVDGEWYLASHHYRRLTRSVADLSFPELTEQRFFSALQDFSKQFSQGSYRVRLRYNRQGHLHLSGFDLPHSPRDSAPAAIRLSHQSFVFDALLVHKTTERSRYDALWVEEGKAHLWDILLWNAQGELTEFTRGNLVLEQQGQYYTPPLACGLLAGTLRQSLCDEGKLLERVLRKNDLEHADQLWFINSIRGWVAVTLEP